MRCVIRCCNQPAQHDHHVIPQSHGGVNLPTVALCATHHQAIHKAALFKGDWTSHYTLAEVVDMAPLVKALKQTMLQPATGPAVLQIKITRLQLQRLHQLKLDNGFSSLESFIRSIIVKLTNT